MNLIICSSDYKPREGGIAEFMFNVGKSLAELGVNVYAMAPNMEGAADFDKCNKYFYTYRTVEVCDVGSFSYKKILTSFGRFVKTVYGLTKLYRYLLRVVDEKDINHIICFYWDVFGVVALFVSKRRKIPYYIVAHGLDVIRKENTFVWVRKYSFQWLIQKIVFKNSNGIFVNSNYTKSVVLKHVTANKNVHVTYCGVDIKKYFKWNTRPIFDSPSVGDNAKILLSITRLVRRKGIDNAIMAFAEFLKKYKDLKVLYLIGGVGPDYQRLKNIVDELELQNKVIFLGFVSEDQKSKLYNLADVFIMPSREEKDGDVEGFGIVFLEANACGKPVIAGNSGGVSDAVQDGITGLLVNPFDIQDIMSKIERLIFDESYAAQLGIQGRKRIENGFTWDMIAKRFEIVCLGAQR